jgi:hypothetical protein
MNYVTEEKLYIYSMKKRFEVLGIFDNNDEANKYMENHDRAAVIAVVGNLVFLADKYAAIKGE